MPRLTLALSELPQAVAGERLTVPGTTPELSYYRAGVDGDRSDTRPLLVVHSINASGSAFEMGPLVEHYAATRPVYAVDLPGFGFSDRSDRPYTPRLMTDALHAMLVEIERDHGPGPVDAIALSLSCEYLARAAAEAPQRFRRLALISPTGFSGTQRRDGPTGSSRFVPALYRLLRWSIWRQALYGLLTRPRVIRYFLERTWGSRAIDEGLLAYDVLTTKVAGAEFAPLYFLSAGLFSKDISRIYDSLQMPVWLSHGTRGDFTDYRGLAALRERRNWQLDVFEGGALPHFEQRASFMARCDRFFDSPESTS